MNYSALSQTSTSFWKLRGDWTDYPQCSAVSELFVIAPAGLAWMKYTLGSKDSGILDPFNLEDISIHIFQ